MKKFKWLMLTSGIAVGSVWNLSRAKKRGVFFYIFAILVGIFYVTDLETCGKVSALWLGYKIVLIFFSSIFSCLWNILWILNINLIISCFIATDPDNIHPKFNPFEKTKQKYDAEYPNEETHDLQEEGEETHLLHREDAPPQNNNLILSDGGRSDNYGVLPLLCRREEDRLSQIVVIDGAYEEPEHSGSKFLAMLKQAEKDNIIYCPDIDLKFQEAFEDNMVNGYANFTVFYSKNQHAASCEIRYFKLRGPYDKESLGKAKGACCALALNDLFVHVSACLVIFRTLAH